MCMKRSAVGGHPSLPRPCGTQQSFPEDFTLPVAQNCHGVPVVQKIMCQVGDNRTQNKVRGVSIHFCSGSTSFYTGSSQVIKRRLHTLSQNPALASQWNSPQDEIQADFLGAESDIHGVLGQTGHSPRRAPASTP